MNNDFRFVLMKRNITTIAALAILFVSCNNTEAEVSAESQTPESTEQEIVEQEAAPEVLTTEQLVLGDWHFEYDMDGTVIEILLTLREDGTYFQSMAGNPVDGTWEFIDEEHIVVKNEHIKSEEGQQWQIVKSTPEELYIDWNVAGGEAKVLEFKRKS